MKVIVLTLERLKARQEAIARNLNAVGVEFCFFKGFDASRGEHEAVSRYDAEACRRSFGATLSAGEIACFAGHYALWQQCRSEDTPLVIMEDDVAVLPAFPQALALAEQRIAQHRYLRLAAIKSPSFRVLEEVGEWKLVRFLKGPLGGHCYGISPEGADALLARADRWIAPVDGYMDAFWRHGVECKALLPLMTHIDNDPAASEIGARAVVRTGRAKFAKEKTRLLEDAGRIFYNLTHRDDVTRHQEPGRTAGHRDRSPAVDSPPHRA